MGRGRVRGRRDRVSSGIAHPKCSPFACPAYVCLQDPSTQLLWWNLVICDPQASEPGIYEAAGWADASGYARYRWVGVRCAVHAVLHAGQAGSFIETASASAILHLSCRPAEAFPHRTPVLLPSRRNARVSWDALQAMLRQVVDARGNVTAWRQRYWKTGRWRLLMRPGGKISYDGNC